MSSSSSQYFSTQDLMPWITLALPNYTKYSDALCLTREHKYFLVKRLKKAIGLIYLWGNEVSTCLKLSKPHSHKLETKEGNLFRCHEIDCTSQQ